jgi:hypothetical protein
VIVQDQHFQVEISTHSATDAASHPVSYWMRVNMMWLQLLWYLYAGCG